ncbi:VOC family protein [Cytobacillus gottheilii]|uniref:VOC family protein n=1 Tax=Cytobacillus gottheilii TaxID=859144 RepID=A0ABX8FDN2_9BACI|nr:VOC family protein [Cytobacillus gottheilii]QVY62213.1 VOC family protein [Cytobacillus gottheilii]
MIVNMYPYIVLNGNGKEAIKFYEEALGAVTESVTTFGDSHADPDFQIPEEAKNRIMNAQLKIGKVELMLSDTFPGQPYELGSQVTVAIIPEGAEEARAIFEKLSAGGKIGMEIQETFWSPAYGQVTDQFGISWQISAQAK